MNCLGSLELNMKKENKDQKKTEKQFALLVSKAHSQPGIAELMEVHRKCEELLSKAKVYFDLERDDLKSISATHTH